MAAPPVLTLQESRLSYGGTPLFEGLDLTLSPGERACLVGRNGSGKSTLLKVLSGLVEPDSGSRVVQSGLRLSYLPQDPDLPAEQTVSDYIAEGLPPDEADVGRYRVDAMLDLLSLDGAASLGSLSGGESRRVALARMLVSEPDVMLLDEPTNHLDLPTIEWLEGELARFRGAFIVISHDRAFLEKVSNATFWLDRGQVRQLNKGFAAFDDWAEEVARAEKQELYRLRKTIEREEHWLQRGVTARRKRNVGRLKRLQELRQSRAEMMKNQPGQLSMAAAEAGTSGKIVIEAEDISKSFTRPDGERITVVDSFSTRIRRGDRVGIVGRNGAGKTTLIRLLLGRMEPDQGNVKLGTNLEVQIFDQRRESLDPGSTLWETLCPLGGDSVMVGGRQRHVVAYLRDFLFDERQVKQPVSSLSGGEKNRLLLARLFAQPSNLLVLDEPTNDLDMDTLDLLVEVLDDYEGTLLLVSHDRDFLDRLTSSVILMDGRGGAQEYPGGYSDAVRQAGGLPDARTGKDKAARKAPQGGKAQAAQGKPKASAPKLSYKEQRELDKLPEQIAKLETEVAELEAHLADPDYYGRDPEGFQTTTDKLERRRSDLEKQEERWLELEDKRERLKQGGGS